MPRFNADKYQPGQDSSEGYKQEADDKGVVVLATVRETRKGRVHRDGCPCGCRTIPKGKDATFAMGHDQRLRGKLIRAHLTDTPIQEILEGADRQPKPKPAAALAVVHGWEEYLTAAEERRTAKNKEVLAKAMGSDRLVKVGRWSYTGQVIAVYNTPGGEEYDVEYVTATGNKKKIRVPADQAPLAGATS